MEVDAKLRESKLKTVSVGGLAMPDGKIQRGFRGCIQVSPLARVETYCYVAWIDTRRFISPQGLRIGGALSLSQARKVNVEPGCSVPDPCSSNPCPANSYCRDDWDSHSCTCLAGQFVALFLLVSVETAHPCFALFDRLLRQQLHRRVLVEPLQARINMYEEAELLPRLHLRLFQELLWSLLREKVSFLD